MQTLESLAARLRALDGRGYKAYKSIKGAYRADGFTLHIDHVQGDPFAEPSRVRVLVDAETASLPRLALRSRIRRIAAADFLNRVFHRAIEGASGHRGSGRSGELSVLRPGQEVLERTSLQLRSNGEIDVRFRAGLPSRGRRISGVAAAALLCDTVPEVIRASLVVRNLDGEVLRRHVEVVEDADALRAQLAARGLVAFVGDGAVLPRRSGIDDRPLPHPAARAFTAPPSLRVTLDAPNAGPVTGMGVPAGVTLIVGGGYHGKSTLLRAIERGVYDHIPGDGRERVVTIRDAVKVRAEDGRSIAGTDISNFIGALPSGADTRRMTTANASGSTSQAAAIVEALEVGARCLLLDEDTSATNFLIRDARMQALIAEEFEPITPLIDRIRTLADDGVSTIVVVGGAGDYFDVADTVIAMRAYEPAEVTAEARAIAAAHPSGRRAGGGGWTLPADRVPLPHTIDPRRGRREVALKIFTRDRLQFGAGEIDLRAVEQLVERAQTRAIADALVWARGRTLDGRRTLAQALHDTMRTMEEEGLDVFHVEHFGEQSAFRVYELAAMLNRIRGLETMPAGESMPGR